MFSCLRLWELLGAEIGKFCLSNKRHELLNTIITLQFFGVIGNSGTKDPRCCKNGRLIWLTDSKSGRFLKFPRGEPALVAEEDAWYGVDEIMVITSMSAPPEAAE